MKPNRPVERVESPMTGAATAALPVTHRLPSQYSYFDRSVTASSGTRDRYADPARPEGVPNAYR